MSYLSENWAKVEHYMSITKNPMCTVHEITKVITGRYVDSNDYDYRKTYRMLEKMTEAGFLFGRSTVNGGNVYILKTRVISPKTQPVNNGGENELPF